MNYSYLETKKRIAMPSISVKFSELLPFFHLIKCQIDKETLVIAQHTHAHKRLQVNLLKIKTQPKSPLQTLAMKL